MKEALTGDLSGKWKQAADAEYDSLLQNKSWDLVELSSGRETIGSKWVFMVKPHGADGKVERFKARLVKREDLSRYAREDGSGESQGRTTS